MLVSVTNWFAPLFMMGVVCGSRCFGLVCLFVFLFDCFVAFGDVASSVCWLEW